MQQKMIQFSGDVSLPAIGQGTWYMGEDASQRKTEVAALRAGIELGLTLIDTAEMYADGGAEKVVGEALIGLRDNVFLVSKVYPWNAGGQKAINACEASLRRLNTDYLDTLVWQFRSRRDCRSDGKIDRPGKNPPLGRF